MIGLVTYAKAPQLTDDDRPLIAELARESVQARAVVWDDPQVDWTRYDTLVLRSCWDYHLRPEEFAAWLRTVEARGITLWNSYDVVRWNMHKSYLRALSSQGVLVARTAFLERGCATSLSAVMERNELRDAIVKPAISASATDTWRTGQASGDTDRFARLIATGDVLVQEFIADVTLRGEWSLIFIDGHFSHAGIKRPKAGDFRVQTEHGGSVNVATPPRHVLDASAAIARLIPGDWLFARIDGVETDRGYVLMEVECIEPHLFFEHAPEARRHLAEALARGRSLTGPPLSERR
jgi:glutathione synthase/RimK-type ligase-like ATP-grasp enzyme